MSGLTILHNPPPAGLKELTDLISCLNNCHTFWHVADLDVYACARVCTCVVFVSASEYVSDWYMGVTARTDGQ